LEVFQPVNAEHLPHSGEQERETPAVPSEKSVARSGSEADAMRMISTCFARVLQRNTCSLDMHFLLIFQEVVSISKTCNQLPAKSPLSTPN
jgi:hypothetical protein